ncbi:MAG: RluA family pseudouridine synthase [Oscillospiraceae bacterium]|nr:RluA family pseudouridine synthase [Oscillospiraceae bacterium]
MELSHIATREGRLSTILREEMKLSAGLMNKLKWNDRILVNGKPQHTDYQVKVSDTVTVLMDESKPQYPAEDGALDIIYEDDYILAVDKKPQMLIHPSRSRDTGTLANLVIGYYQKKGLPSAFHPVTRLDRDTFGIVLLAKNAYAHALLQATQLQKTYHALTFGGPEEDSGIIDAPIQRLPLPSLLRQVHPDGKPSQTQYTVLQWDKICKLALAPITGRTHQLRVHCAYMGFPILGDPQYGSDASKAFSESLGLNYQQLCAKRLEFIHPITGEEMSLESKMDVRATMSLS